MKNIAPEKFLGVLGFIVCFITCLRIAQVLLADPHQELFPLPAFYLLEMTIVSLLAAISTFQEGERWNLVPWAASGITFAFVLIAGFSIGFFFVPTAFLILIVALLSWRRHHNRLLIDAGICVTAFIAQIILVFAMIRILYPDARF